MDDPSADEKRADPMLLDIIAVDKILEFLDSDSLLTCRLVCRSWHELITNRDRMWKRRCQQNPVHVELETSRPSETFYLRSYIGAHGVSNTMRSPRGFQMDQHSNGLDCLLRAREDACILHTDILLSEVWDFSDANMFDGTQDFAFLGLNRVLIFEEYHRLLQMIDLELLEVLWDHDDLKLICLRYTDNLVYVTTRANIIQRITLDGQVESELNIGRDVFFSSIMAVHPCKRFILFVGFEYPIALLVDYDNKKIVTFELPFPQPSEDDDEAHIIDHADFLTDEGLGDDQLAFCAYTQVVIISTSGEVLHHATKEFVLRLWVGTFVDRSVNNQFVIRTNTQAEKYGIHCKPSGITLQPLWKKPFSDRLKTVLVLSVGDQFLLASENNDLLIYRMEDGSLVSSIPFFSSAYCRNRASQLRVYDATGETVTVLARHVQLMQAISTACRSEITFFFLTNTTWLNRLSPGTTQHDVPVLMYISNGRPIRCLRWPELDDLWKDLEPEPEEGE